VSATRRVPPGKPAPRDHHRAGQAEAPLRTGGAAVTLRRDDKRLMNLLQSSYPLAGARFDLVASEAELDPVVEVKERTQR